MKPLLAAVLALCLPLRLNALSIGMFSDEGCDSCSLSVPVGQAGTFFVRFTGGGGRFQLIGADFKIVGLPASWTASVEPNPERRSVFGDVFNGGAMITFPTPHTEECFDLYRVTIHATSALEHVVLHVETSDNPFWGANCPLVLYPAPPDPPYSCAEGGFIFINSAGHCAVSVERRSWSDVKVLYELDG